MEVMKKFIIWEAASRDTIDVKRCYIDITGDLVSGVLLSQIIFWFLPNRANQLKVQILKDGRYWLCKERTEWWDECRVSEYQFDRAIKELCQKGVIIKKLYKFDGAPKVHLSVDFDVLNTLLLKYYTANKEALEANMGLANLLTGTVVEPTEKESYLSKLKGIKLELYNQTMSFYGNKVVDNIKSDTELKEFIFEMFWDIYDYKQRKERAVKAFKKLGFEEIKKVLDVAPGYVKVVVKYKLLPHNYLNDKVFNEPLPQQSEQKPNAIKPNIPSIEQNIDKDTTDYFSKYQ